MTEAQLHKAVADYLRLALKPPTIWTTIGHGGGGRVRGAQLKAKGVQPGWPDIIVMDPAGTWTNVMGFELKAKKGSQSAAQRAIERAFHGCRADYYLCHSLKDVVEALLMNGVQLHASLS